MKNVDWIKVAILFAIAAVVMLLIQRYDQFQTKQFDERQQARQIEEAITIVEDSSMATTKTQPSSVANSDFDVEAPAEVTKTKNPITQSKQSVANQLISVETNVIRAQIDPLGGDIVSIELLQHKIKQNSHEPIELLNNRLRTRYIAESGLIGTDGIDRKARPLYQTEAYHYQAVDAEVVVDLTIDVDAVHITKRYRFRNDDYLIDLDYLIDNQTDRVISMDLLAQIRRTGYVPEGRDLGMAAFVGAAVTTPEERYLRYDFDEMDDLIQPYHEIVDNGWVAMVQRYFVSAWVAASNKPIKYSIRHSKNKDYYLMGYTQQGVKLNASERGAISAGFYAGPKDQYRLREIGNNLDLTVDYGWLWWAAQPLYAVLNFIYTGTFNAFGLNVEIFRGIPN